MSSAWALEVSRTDLADTALEEVDVPEPAEGETVLRADRVGVTANNVTYAVLGDSFRYWEFFPASASTATCRPPATCSSARSGPMTAASATRRRTGAPCRRRTTPTR